MATGGGTKKALGTRAMAAMIALTTAQQQDVRAANEGGPTNMTDESSLAVTQPSPLELPQRSYTTEPEAGDNGAAGTIAELQAQRRREAKMRETAEQFVGAPSIPSAEAPSEEPGTQRSTQAGPQEEEAEEPEEAQDAIADMSQLDSERAQEGAEQQRRGDLAQKISAQSAADATAHRRKELAKIYNGVTDLNGFASFTGFNFMVYLAMSNAKIFNEFTFKNYDRIPKPSLLDMGRTLFANITCCLCSPSMCIWFIFACVIAGAVLVIFTAITSLLGG